MIVAILVLGAVTAALGWRLVEARRTSIWVVMGLVNAALGLAALVTGRIRLSLRLAPAGAAAAGLAAGVALYAATVLFVGAVRRWPAFDRHVQALYGNRGSLTTPVAIVLAAGVVAPGEELFWRGLFQSHLATGGSRVTAAAVTWAVYVAANAAGLSLPIAAAAVVGGGVWGLLAMWTGGVLASLLCHAVWTGLMVGLPPPGAVARGPAGSVDA